MGKIQSRTDLSSLETPEEFQRHGAQAISNMADVVNGQLEFDKNFKSQTVTVTFTSADTDTSVTHSLKKTNVNYMVVKKSANCSVYDGAGKATANRLFLRSSSAATVTLVLF